MTVENDALLARAFPRFWRVLDEVVASSGLIDAAVPKE
jgi:hypothetical protein